MDEDYVDRTDIEFIDFQEKNVDNARYWEHLRKVDLGPVVAADMSCLPPTTSVNDIDKFRTVCREFFISLASEIYKRFPFNDRSVRVLKAISFVEPECIKDHRNISAIARFFGYDVENVHKEFRTSKTMFKDEHSLEAKRFWKKVRSLENTDNTPEFPLIMEIVDRIAVLLHSSANSERIFSKINLNKKPAE